ncbi:MAG: low specificity L-threonine aldolase [Planctomycetales bacterium]|nr:low specificity L-threonine aldolase [Planctomycetales bacterium]
MTVDLRSDTVTRPSEAMRKAMAESLVGDDVIDTDPTILELQALTAELLGKEAAIFMPSGTMTNQIAVRIHCKPGDEFLCESSCHIFNYEQGAFAQLSGVVGRTLPGDGGVLAPAQFHGTVRPIDEHLVRTRLVCLENTHNRGGGRVQPFEWVEEICDWAHESGLRTHLDGARLFNAVVASGRSAADWARPFDTVSVCFSKGLGAPVGSALAGDKEAIREARFHRKLFGGGMRQAGVIAAGALYALRNNIQRLADDHAHARILAEAIERSPGLSLPRPVETNIVIFDVSPELGTAAEYAATLEQRGVRMFAMGPTQVRAVTHLDVSEAEVRCAADIMEEVAAGLHCGDLQPAQGGLAY